MMKTKKENKIPNYLYFVGGFLLLLIIFIAVYFGGNGKMNDDIKTNPVVDIQTNKGLISVELYPDKAPKTVDNFLRYVNEEFYDNTVFHRVITDFMIQGGGFTVDGNQKSTHEPIPIESNNGLSNDRGTIAMARTSDPNSATSQFFINLVNNSFLNYGTRDEGYAVFGKVIKGMNIVDLISTTPTGSSPMPDWPLEPIVIEKVTVRN